MIMSVSIGHLEQSIKKLASKLNKKGLFTSLYTFRSGHYFDLGASYVELEVDDLKGNSVIVKFLANGYGAISKDELSGSIKEMKSSFFEIMEKEGINIKS